MTRATKVKKARRAQAPPKAETRIHRGLLFVAVLGAIGLIAAAALVWRASGDDGETFSGVPAADPGPVHVHGLGVNPADGALFIATHTGLYRVEKDERKAERVGGRYQDTMGFANVGPNRFLGSGHPDLNEAREKNLPRCYSADRGELTRKAIDRAGEILGAPLDPQRVLVIGDTPKDIAAAHAARAIGIGVASGHYSEDDLREAGAD